MDKPDEKTMFFWYLVCGGVFFCWVRLMVVVATELLLLFSCPCNGLSCFCSLPWMRAT